ncbi:hypothetical protein CPLU01_01578 [Colletotrichum plurivorum]|uniref:Uncharacterized protein n=1 Tax=Colletotrichum plurivorum TaxID=2175906 RepID=A0A8H6KYS4_9PEZI|nr:hypothetical protein CPLU01_01578 [Colletotrichum plurivorum]
MHYSLLKSLIAFGLLSTAMARDYHYYRDTPARQTPAAESPEYDAGLSPVPTPESGLELRDAVLGPRSLAPENCGYRQREDGGFGALRCVSGTDCRTIGSHFGCYSVPHTRCFDGTESICQQSTVSLGALSRCCTESNSVYLPYCVTFLKEDGGQKTMLRCGQPIHGNRRIMFLGSETDDPDATRTAASTDASPTTPSSASQDSQTASSTPSTMPTPNPDPPSSGGGSNTGAIVGGVVTSVAVVAIAACIIVWMVLRRRRQARQDAAPGGAPGGAEMPATPGQQSQFSQPYYGGGYQDQPAQGVYDEQQYKQQQQPIYEAPGNHARNRNVAELGA